MSQYEKKSNSELQPGDMVIYGNVKCGRVPKPKASKGCNYDTDNLYD